MYCTSEAYLKKMQPFIAEIEAKSEGVLRFEECISLPWFGHTILRFDIAGERVTQEQLDRYEALMQSVVRGEYLVDFMGRVYQKVGFSPEMYEDRFRKCYHKYSDIPIPSGEERNMLRADAEHLLTQCGLPSDWKVWEIQIEEEIRLLVLGRENREIGTYKLPEYTVQVYEVDEMPCIGLMRAVMCAQANQISLVRMLLEA